MLPENVYFIHYTRTLYTKQYTETGSFEYGSSQSNSCTSFRILIHYNISSTMNVDYQLEVQQCMRHSRMIDPSRASVKMSNDVRDAH